MPLGGKKMMGKIFYHSWLKKIKVFFTGDRTILSSKNPPIKTNVASPANHSKFLKKRNELLKNGVRINAMVLRVEDTGLKINIHPVVLLSLRIEAFTSMVVQVTSEVLITSRRPKPGERILIAFNPDDTGIVAIL